MRVFLAQLGLICVGQIQVWPPGGGGGHCHIWAIKVFAAVKGTVFKQFTLA